MTKGCSVPGCKSNHGSNSPYVSCFRVPKKDVLRKKWMELIHRKDLCPLKEYLVCIRHFSKNMLTMRANSAINEDGSPRPKMVLKAGAYPTLNLPKASVGSGIVKRSSAYVGGRQKSGRVPVHRASWEESAAHFSMMSSLGPEDSSIECGQCDYVAYDVTDLELHTKLQHGGTPLFSCPYCDYESNIKLQIYPHLSIHANEKPFKCSHCCYSTDLNTDITRHLKIHSHQNIPLIVID